MGCIRLDQVTEYLLEPLRKCCTDPDPYVRKTCAICIPKVYDINPELVEEQHFLEILKEMLSDNNPMVVANAVAGLSEISQTCGRDLIDLDNKATIPKLLAALNECNEWGQVFILDAMSTYVPQGNNDAESITERITARLSHANPAVVLSAIKVVLKCMDYIDNSEVSRTLLKKLNPPLVTLLSGEPEIQYVALRNIRLILQKRPGILASDVKMFFCKYNDPVYVKLEKVDIMVTLATEKNFEQVLLELKEYATGVDVEFVRRSVRSIGRVAVKLERACERTVSVLLELIDTKVNYVVQEATVVIKDIFRKYPSRYEQVLQALCESLEVLDEPEAKASMIWILGEYAERIDNVEGLMDEFLLNFHDEPLMVQMQLLTGIVKLFLKKPSTGQELVSRVLKCATEDSPNHDLRDRGYIYWRLLSTNPEATKNVVLGDKPSIRDDSQAVERSLLDKLIKDLSLMSSVYQKLPSEFVTRINAVAVANDDRRVQDEEEGADDEDRAERRREVQQEMERDRKGESVNGTSRASGGGMDLLDLDGGDAPSPAPLPAAVQKIAVLSPQQPGQGGSAGFGVLAALTRVNGQIVLQMSFANRAQAPLGGFAIQVNKNSFGIGPAAALSVADISPGGTAEVSLPMQVGVLNNNQPPANTLFLQVAVKNSLDVFYFNVPFDISCVLTEGPALTRDQFSGVWQGVGEGRQHTTEGHTDRALSEDDVRQQLQGINVHYVAKRGVDASTHVYVAATTSMQNVLTAELVLRGNNVKVVTRTEMPQLAPLLDAAIRKRLGIA
eukprot:TRINITY_DN54548_c0_g1_i1.p1 TRINITY_DN54548_c0_g1~~TRINITY_DN54548_c0_g1_i1.p1  ORF type:complete len:917 (-),score=185.79 TRINITY_DN54548_c0_g1_i1:76-2430(-)